MAPVIDRVEVVLLSIPRKRGMAPAENLLVRIHANDGSNGVGACQYESRYGETAAEAALVVQKHYTPLLLKENPLSIETLMKLSSPFTVAAMITSLCRTVISWTSSPCFLK